MNITFDTNVWERLINEEEHHLVEIQNRILDGKIQAYICEIALDLEAIQKKLRARVFGNYKSHITEEHLPPENGELGIRVSVGPNTELHPGLPPEQWDKLLEARDLGFQILGMTNFGTIRTKEIPDDMYVQHDDIDEFWKYAELLADCNDFIIELGCGRAAYDQFRAQFNLAVPDKQKKNFSKAIAEWVDGDSLSAHYAAGNDFFCTNDKAGNAGTGSIFHNQNRDQLEKEFGIKIISSKELSDIISLLAKAND